MPPERAPRTSPGVTTLDPSQPRAVHVVGVGGAGMSAIASVLAAMGHRVTGSDLKPSPALERLAASGVEVFVGHEAAHVGDAEVLAVSTAVSEANPEVVEGRRRGLAVLSRAEALAQIAATRRCVAVSGTHGKTTTTSMLALILVEAGLRPSFLIGGDVNEIGTNAVWDIGDWLVLEADESDATFLALDPEIAVVTNVEPDHLDHYGDFDHLVSAFDQFLSSPSNGAVVGADDPVAAELGARHGAVLVGESPSSTYQIHDLESAESVSFTLRVGDEDLGRVALPITGAKLARNAAVAVVAALRAGAPFDAAQRALARFAGVARRFESRGEAGGVRYVDDYAHLPAEVSAVIAAARGIVPTRLVVVFQPHRYSRIAALGRQFADAFSGADVVVITEIFSAGETPVPGVTGRIVADAVRQAHPALDIRYVAGRAELCREVASLLVPGDLCLTLGAGDLTSLPDELRAAAPMSPPRSTAAHYEEARALDALAVALGGRAQRDAPLGARTTYRVGGPAALLVEADSSDDLARVHDALATVEVAVPVLVLGEGSNLLVADAGFAGLVVAPGAGFAWERVEAPAVRAGGRTKFPVLARRTAAAGLRGLEWAVGVPGSVGGALRMNAGGHGSDTAAVLARYEVFDLRSGAAVEALPDRLALGYRRSSLDAAEFVTWAEFALTPGDRAEAEAELAEIVRWRRANQPGGANAGSVFVNPEGDSAGRLVEAAGLKGLRMGTAQVSTKHANFVQADAGGAADDVWRLIAHVRAVVAERTGVDLVPEVRAIGFPDAAPAPAQGSTSRGGRGL